jgi:hypothetical protein
MANDASHVYGCIKPQARAGRLTDEVRTCLPMAAFMGVELTWQYQLFPRHCCRAVARDWLRVKFQDHSLYAIATPAPMSS